MKGFWIEFTGEWMGNLPGSRRHVWEPMAKELVARGVAKVVDSEESVTVKKLTIAEVPLEEVEEVAFAEKAIEAPPKDKMVRRKYTKTR